MNHEIPDVQAGFRKGRGTRYQIANNHWIIHKTREFQNNIYFCFIDYAKAFDCGSELEILKEMGISDHITCLLRNCMQVKKLQLELDMIKGNSFQIGKGVHQGLFNLYTECIMQNAGLDESQVGIKIAGRHINNFKMHMILP